MLPDLLGPPEYNFHCVFFLSLLFWTLVSLLVICSTTFLHGPLASSFPVNFPSFHRRPPRPLLIPQASLLAVTTALGIPVLSILLSSRLPFVPGQHCPHPGSSSLGPTGTPQLIYSLTLQPFDSLFPLYPTSILWSTMFILLPYNLNGLVPYLPCMSKPWICLGCLLALDRDPDY